MRRMTSLGGSSEMVSNGTPSISDRRAQLRRTLVAVAPIHGSVVAMRRSIRSTLFGLSALTMCLLPGLFL